MMKTDLREGKVCCWALIFSVAAHSVALAVFAGVKLSGRPDADAPAKPVISMQMIERAVVEPAPKPKPRIEPIAKDVVQPESKHPPLVSEPEPAKPVIADTLPEVPVSEPIIPAKSPLDEVEFFGQKSAINRVCYVVDCSGSMYGLMYQVKDQLKKSILNLNSRQSFCVVFFMEGEKIVASGNGELTLATAGAKSTALELIESIRPSGLANPENALEAAMRLKDASGQKAEAIYFLTDGFDLKAASSRAFVKKVDRLRSRYAPGTLLHIIGFSVQPLERQMLRQLAHDTGGAFIEVK